MELQQNKINLQESSYMIRVPKFRKKAGKNQEQWIGPIPHRWLKVLLLQLCPQCFLPQDLLCRVMLCSRDTGGCPLLFLAAPWAFPPLCWGSAASHISSVGGCFFLEKWTCLSWHRAPLDPWHILAPKCALPKISRAASTFRWLPLVYLYPSICFLT